MMPNERSRTRGIERTPLETRAGRSGSMSRSNRAAMRDPDPKLPPPDPDPEPQDPPIPGPNPDEPGPDVVPQIDPELPQPQRLANCASIAFMSACTATNLFSRN